MSKRRFDAALSALACASAVCALAVLSSARAVQAQPAAGATGNAATGSAATGSAATTVNDKPGLDPDMVERVRTLALSAATAAAPAGARVEVAVAPLDARYKLAPCQQVQPYLPQGLQMWGRTRIGLRCADLLTRWNITLPVVVRVYARALVAQEPLSVGVVLTQAHLASAEIDIAAEPGAIFTEAGQLIGRSLSRPLAAGDAIHSSALRQRQWFAAGETVKVVAVGPGFAAASEGQALAAGLEGQEVKVRFESGRVVSGRAVGERRVEVLL